MTQTEPAASPVSTAPRRVLLVAHTGREPARAAAREVAETLTQHGLVVRLLAAEAAELGVVATDGPAGIEVVADEQGAGRDCELTIVVGGDGTILRAAEVTRGSGTPILGVNLGHVGFLAEAEHDDVASTIQAVVARDYATEDRLTLDVLVLHAGAVLARTFAVNEASVEKAARQRMLEVVVEIDGRPLSRWGCDGVVCATPTGSTAYNFSAGGPVVWPGVEALLMVPISAHALFARPLVAAPTSVLAVEVLDRAGGTGILWCDGRRAVDLPPGARIEVRRSEIPLRLVRLTDSPFTDRLVAKFGLPVQGWRGAAERRAGLVADAVEGSP